MTNTRDLCSKFPQTLFRFMKESLDCYLSVTIQQSSFVNFTMSIKAKQLLSPKTPCSFLSFLIGQLVAKSATNQPTSNYYGSQQGSYTPSSTRPQIQPKWSSPRPSQKLITEKHGFGETTACAAAHMADTIRPTN